MTIYRILTNVHYILVNNTKTHIIYKYFVHLIFLYFSDKKLSAQIKFNKIIDNKKYKFTMNNIGQSIYLLNTLKKKFENRKVNVLILGCFEGMSSVFFLNNFNINIIHCVDKWDIKTYKKSKSSPNLFAEKFFDNNLSSYKSMIKYKMCTKKFFKKNICLIHNDIIYIDASTNYLDVANDAFNSDRILKSGGYLIFNSFLWRQSGKIKQSNLAGINLFLDKKYKNYKIISISSNMLILKKINFLDLQLQPEKFFLHIRV